MGYLRSGVRVRRFGDINVMGTLRSLYAKNTRASKGNCTSFLGVTNVIFSDALANRKLTY